MSMEKQTINFRTSSTLEIGYWTPLKLTASWVARLLAPEQASMSTSQKIQLPGTSSILLTLLFATQNSETRKFPGGRITAAALKSQDEKLCGGDTQYSLRSVCR